MKIFLFSLCCAVLSFSSLVSAGQYNMELRGEFESWNTGLGGTGNGILGGAGMGYHTDKYFTGGGFTLGNYNLETDADKSVQRIDFDAVVGKRIDSHWSIFTGYRYNRLNFASKNTPSSDIRENTLGAGVGTSFSLPVASNWALFMTGAISGLYSYNNFDWKGKGYSVGVEGGAAFSVNEKISISIRAKYQTSNIIYDVGDDWIHSYNRVGATLAYLL